MKPIATIILLTATAATAYLGGRCTRPAATAPAAPGRTIHIDTIHDTIIRPTVATPPRTVGHMRRRLPVAQPDTTAAPRDTVEVELPRTQITYADSNYTAWISGYQPSLDSIAIRHTVSTITITPAPQVGPRRRWGIGITAGYGYAPHSGFSPYIGIGITYTLVNF